MGCNQLLIYKVKKRVHTTHLSALLPCSTTGQSQLPFFLVLWSLLRRKKKQGIFFKRLRDAFWVFVCLFLLYSEACRILVPWAGIEPVPPASEVRGLHQTTREFPRDAFWSAPLVKGRKRYMLQKYYTEYKNDYWLTWVGWVRGKPW